MRFNRLTLLPLLAIAAALAVPAPGAALDLCGGSAQASSDQALQALFQEASLPREAQPELAILPTKGQVPAMTWCTKEQCSAARAACREWCPYPCAMQFTCTTPYCGSCISCSC